MMTVRSTYKIVSIYLEKRTMPPFEHKDLTLKTKRHERFVSAWLVVRT